MPERFTETLRAASEPLWSQAVGHRFVTELFTGAVPDTVMARYLIQDHRFLDSFLLYLAPRLLYGGVAASFHTVCQNYDAQFLASRRLLGDDEPHLREDLRRVTFRLRRALQVANQYLWQASSMVKPRHPICEI